MGNDDRERGQRFYELVFGRRKTTFSDLLDNFTIDHLFANVWSRTDKLSTVNRSKITVAMLAALGRDSELKAHLKGARHQGISDGELEEIMLHVAHYAGWPAGHRGLAILDEVTKTGRQVSWLLELKVKPEELDNFKVLLDQMVESTRNEPGTLNYEWFISDDEKAVFGYERYGDSVAAMTHLKVFAHMFAENFLATTERARLTVLGDPNDELREALRKPGPDPIYYRFLQGFARDQG